MVLSLKNRGYQNLPLNLTVTYGYLLIRMDCLALMAKNGNNIMRTSILIGVSPATSITGRLGRSLPRFFHLPFDGNMQGAAKS